MTVTATIHNGEQVQVGDNVHPIDYPEYTGKVVALVAVKQPDGSIDVWPEIAWPHTDPTVCLEQPCDVVAGRA